MKKILSILLLIFLFLLAACGKVKYEYKDGIMYENDKKATGIFEITIDNNLKSKVSYVNGLENGLTETYDSEGNIFTRIIFKDGESLKEEIFYRNGQLMSSTLNDENNIIIQIYLKNGKKIMSSNEKKNEEILYHENGKPMIITNLDNITIYNENNDLLFKVVNKEIVDIGLLLEEGENGTFNLLKGDLIVANLDEDRGITYLYSTGEPMLKMDRDFHITEVLFKNGNIFMKQEENRIIANQKDGSLLFEMRENANFLYDDGKEIESRSKTDFLDITEIKKIN